nr:chloride channel protein [Hasllibacter halocynthiae]
MRTCAEGLRVIRAKGPSQLQFWFLALFIGIAAGFAALGFRLGIAWLQELLYRTDDPSRLGTFAADLPWWWLIAVPTAGGLVVGLILHRFTPDARARTVADVIEGAALHDGRVEGRAGLASAAASLITLGTGGSSGREGPVVHLAAVIASKVSRWIKADGVTGRDLLGCAVAAAVSASFNAPIAGALFALEVVLRHFAVHAFAPIAIAAVAGTVINRVNLGGMTEYEQAGTILAFYVELPAFMILGLTSGLVAVVLIRAVFAAESMGNRLREATGMPRWMRPAVAGAMLGALAIWFPFIIGVGYETVSDALSGDLLLREAFVFAVLKVVAVAITLGGRMGGGIFSPALMVGALTGLAFGLVASIPFPGLSSGAQLYALAGMGAVAAAVLGAPISTTLIVFELTGDWQTGIAVMVSVSLSTALASRLVHRSFFLAQLERRGIHLAAGPQSYLWGTLRVGRTMRLPGSPRYPDEGALQAILDAGVMAEEGATLEVAMPLFEHPAVTLFVPVVERSDDGTPHVVGSLHRVDALTAYNRALAAVSAEEHS